MKHAAVIQVYKTDNDFFFSLQEVQCLKQKDIIVGCFRCPQPFRMWKDVHYKCFTPVIVITSKWFNYSCFVRSEYEKK